ncbi:MAG TPA: 50S ribosomal protein L7/L12 [Candidatus Kaiserbacteria bacterium]|nr:50S ribosomal protein L7/L12 [Candidatus Kaiserbacteria bacterium]
MSDEVKKEESTTEAPAEETTPKVEETATEATTETKTEEAPEEETENVEVPEQFKKLVEQVETMTVLELSELVKVLEKKFGVSASAVAVAAPGAAGAGDAEEKSTVTVELSDIGGNKISVIKAVKEILALGLKEAKDIVDSAPSVLKEDIKKEDAEELKAKIEEAGGKVTFK